MLGRVLLYLGVVVIVVVVLDPSILFDAAATAVKAVVNGIWDFFGDAVGGIF